MSQLTNTIQDVGKNYKKYDKWEQAQANKMAQKEYLVKNFDVPADKIELTQKRAQAVIRATEIMDTRSENNCENVEQAVGVLASVPSVCLVFAMDPARNILEKYFNKNSKDFKKAFGELEKSNPQKAKELQEFLTNSRIKNFSRKNLKEAETKLVNEIMKITKKNSQKAANISTYGTMGLIFATAIGMILWGNSQQKQASRIGRFQAKQDELKDVENFVVYTPEQLEEANKIAKNIPDKKNRNSISQAFHELKEMQRDRGAYKRWAKQKDPQELEKLKSRNISPEELEKAKVDKELITNIVSEVNIKAEEFSENLENTFDTFGMLSFLLAVPLGFGINKLLKMAKVSPKVNAITSILVPTFTSLGIQIAGTFEQKEAARIGRYHARKDLMKNPHKLMSFSDEEMVQASHIKAPKQKKGLFQKIGESFKFLKDYYKQKREYKNYKEKVQKHNEKLQEAFKYVEITDAQKVEAKSLQQNVFRAFDEVDEMSQRYSEDIEASTEIAKSTATNLFQLAWMGGVAVLGAGIVKGKISLIKPAKLLNNITFDSKSAIGKSLNNVLENLSKSDKATRQEFQRALLGGKKKLKPFFENPKNEEIKKAASEFSIEIENFVKKGAEKVALSNGEKSAEQIYIELFKEQAKQTRIAKWSRNLGIDILKLKTKSKVESLGKEIPKEIQEKLGLNFNYKNYKTLINSGIIGAIPILAPLFAVPYMFNAWLTDIQKKAGKIGVMKAMESIDDPRIFAQQG